MIEWRGFAIDFNWTRQTDSRNLLAFMNYSINHEVLRVRLRFQKWKSEIVNRRRGVETAVLANPIWFCKIDSRSRNNCFMASLTDRSQLNWRKGEGGLRVRLKVRSVDLKDSPSRLSTSFRSRVWRSNVKIIQIEIHEWSCFACNCRD